MTPLSPLDYTLIIIYFVGLIIIGYVRSRRQQADDFLIARRRLGTWSTMATVNASKTGSILMAFVAFTYLWGFSAVWYFIGVIVGVMLFIPFAMYVKKTADKKHYTLADYFKYRYGRRSGQIAGGLSVFLMFGLAIINLIAGTKIFMFFTGWPFWACALIMATIITTYLLLGGFKAVAKTDILQYIAIIFIIGVLVFTLFNGASIPFNEWSFFQTDIASIIGFFIIGILFAFASPDLWQRVYAARGPQQIRNGLWISIFIYAAFAFMLALVALSVKVALPGADPDLALLLGFKELLTPGLVGLSSILLFSAIMSTLDTYLFTAASSLVQDFFIWSKKKTIQAMRLTIFAFAFAGTLIAIAIQSLVIGSYLFASFYAVLAIPAIATTIKKTIKERTLVFSFIAGLLGVIIFLIYSLTQGEVTPTVVIAGIAAATLGLFIATMTGKRNSIKTTNN